MRVRHAGMQVAHHGAFAVRATPGRARASSPAVGALVALVMVVGAETARSQAGVYACPNAGEDTQQQSRHSIECQHRATAQSGFRPGEPLLVAGGGAGGYAAVVVRTR